MVLEISLRHHVSSELRREVSSTIASRSSLGFLTWSNLSIWSCLLLFDLVLSTWHCLFDLELTPTSLIRYRDLCLEPYLTLNDYSTMISTLYPNRNTSPASIPTMEVRSSCLVASLRVYIHSDHVDNSLLSPMVSTALLLKIIRFIIGIRSSIVIRMRYALLRLSPLRRPLL